MHDARLVIVSGGLDTRRAVRSIKCISGARRTRELQTRAQQALDEIRMHVLGLQVLLGSTLQTFLVPLFSRTHPEVPFVMLLSLAAFRIA